MRLGFLADGSLGAPALAFLASTGRLAAVAWGPSDPACRDWASGLCGEQGIPFLAASEGLELGPWFSGASPDLGLVFGLPWRLPPDVLGLPRLGWLNLHGGPLPAYRGPQPVFWQIRNAEPASALVAHRMDAGLDTGPIVASLAIPILPDTTFGALTQALAQAAPGLLQSLLQALDTQGEAILEGARPQGEGRTWPRPGPEDVRIDWSAMPAWQIQALVRACNPWNSGAWTSLQGQPCRVVEASLLDTPVPPGPPGSVGLAGEDGLAVACADGLGLRLDILRLEEGFFSGARLRSMGVGPGARFA
jgi:methionyl-tRNA formyltransferase